MSSNRDPKIILISGLLREVNVAYLLVISNSSQNGIYPHHNGLFKTRFTFHEMLMITRRFAIHFWSYFGHYVIRQIVGTCVVTLSVICSFYIDFILPYFFGRYILKHFFDFL